MIFVPKKRAREVKKRLHEEGIARLEKRMDESYEEYKKSQQDN